MSNYMKMSEILKIIENSAASINAYETPAKPFKYKESKRDNQNKILKKYMGEKD